MTKIVINTCFGGFDLSVEALQLWASLQGKQTRVTQDLRAFDRVTTVPPEELITQPEGLARIGLAMEEREASSNLYKEQHVSAYSIPRDCPYLVQVVEQLGNAAAGRYADLRVVEIPDDVKWHIHEYDGSEHVAEDHRTWS